MTHKWNILVFIKLLFPFIYKVLSFNRTQTIIHFLTFFYYLTEQRLNTHTCLICNTNCIFLDLEKNLFHYIFNWYASCWCIIIDQVVSISAYFNNNIQLSGSDFFFLVENIRIKINLYSPFITVLKSLQYFFFFVYFVRCNSIWPLLNMYGKFLIILLNFAIPPFRVKKIQLWALNFC